jgi:hypothetical protein
MKVVLVYIQNIFYIYNGTIPYQLRDATRHAWGWQLGTQLIHVIQTPWDATIKFLDRGTQLIHPHESYER